MKNNIKKIQILILIFWSLSLLSCKSVISYYNAKKEYKLAETDSITLTRANILLGKYLKKEATSVFSNIEEKTDSTRLEKKIKKELIEKFQAIIDEIDDISLAYTFAHADTAELNNRQKIASENLALFKKLAEGDLVETINDSVLFQNAKWKIATNGKKYLDKHLEKKIGLIKQFDTIKIYCNGYANEGAIYGINLITLLLNDNFDILPNKNKSYTEYEPNRKYLNKLLSDKRAKSTSNYLATLLKLKYKIIKPIIEIPIGYGEEDPCKNCNYKKNDEKRRIVMISIIP